MSAYITFDGVCKYYGSDTQRITALDHMTFEVRQGEFCVIVGPSGAGKTTLLNILGGMDTADSGQVILDGRHIESLNEHDLTSYRRYDVGFVFQFLESVGLADRMDNFPAQLSGGEQQRVAIARAVAKNPKILLCDEPTGALDYNTGKTILRLLYDLCKDTGKTVIVITHNSALKAMADRVILIKNGQAVSQEINEHPEPIENIEW